MPQKGPEHLTRYGEDACLGPRDDCGRARLPIQRGELPHGVALLRDGDRLLVWILKVDSELPLEHHVQESIRVTHANEVVVLLQLEHLAIGQEMFEGTEVPLA